MTIIELRALRGPNYHHRLPVIFCKINIGKLENIPTDEVPNFLGILHQCIPSLENHTCSPGVPGGFYQRIERGTWAAHVTEHVAIELQNLIGHQVSYGKSYTRKPAGIYDIVFRYQNEAVGLRAAEIAWEIVQNLFAAKAVDILPYLSELSELNSDTSLGPSTQSIVDAALQRGISFKRLNQHSYVQLGQGVNQRRFEATVVDSTSAIGVEIAANKARTKEILARYNFPVAAGKEVHSLEETLNEATVIGYPLVLKPLRGNHGRDVIIDIKDQHELTFAFKQIYHPDKSYVLEKYIKGLDYRLLLIDYRLVAVAQRQPAYVIGDGQADIRELIRKENANPKRGEGHENILTKIVMDEETFRALSNQKLSLDTVLDKDQKVYVRSTANISSGGTATDVTDLVHPSIKRMAEDISRVIDLNIIGIDLICEDISQAIQQQQIGIIEVNAGPGFRMHLNPSEGQPRDVGEAVVDMLYPGQTPHQIPIIAVTGTNGKTTTSRLISHIIKESGYRVGMTSTEEIVIAGHTVAKGDYSGPAGAERVLTDKNTEYAVLEVARGGILRRGLGFKRCDVGVLLNVTSDHLGLSDIHTLEDLARTKSTVLEAVKENGFAIANAEDPLTYSRIEKSDGRSVYFSLNPTLEILRQNLDEGNFNVVVQDGQVVIQDADGEKSLGLVTEFPITFDGKAEFNVRNLLASVAATYAAGFDLASIRAGLLSYRTDFNLSAGRMNFFTLNNIEVVIDYGHNIDAIRQTGGFFRSLAKRRLLRLASGTGNRREIDMQEFGKALSEIYDYIIISDPDYRKRQPGETARMVEQGVLDNGYPAENVRIILDEQEAIKEILKTANTGDLVVLQANDYYRALELLKSLGDLKPLKIV